MKENNSIILANSAPLKDPESLKRARGIIEILWQKKDIRALKMMSDFAIYTIWLIQNPEVDMRGYRVESELVLLDENHEERVISEASLLERGITEEEKDTLAGGGIVGR